MIYFIINKIQCGTPYTWYMGFGFEEWTNGKPVRMYCAYYDNDKLACIRTYDKFKQLVQYVVSDDGVAYKHDSLTDYHRNLVEETHRKYLNVYKKTEYYNSSNTVTQSITYA